LRRPKRRRKKLDSSGLLLTALADAASTLSLRCRPAGLGTAFFTLKHRRCPFCACAESLNRHSFLYGNDPASNSGRVLRGQRVFCSDRGQRGGCGRTFSVFLARSLPRHTVSAPLLWPLLVQLLTGRSIKACAEALRLPFALETIYHLLQRLRRRLDVIRSWLCRRQPAPASQQSAPLGQTVEHLQTVFAQADCPLADYQTQFSAAFLG
jgi:hypothetical protein